MSETTTSAPAHLTAASPLIPAIQAWEYYLRDQNRSVYTIKSFMGDLKLLAAFLPPDRPVGGITTQDINHFLLWLQNGRGVPCSPKSLSRRITSIKAFFRWLMRAGIVIPDPAEKVLQQSVISPLPEILTPVERESILDTAKAYRTAKRRDARPYTLLLLLLSTGIKKGECLAVELNHIDLDAPSGPLLFVRYQAQQNRYKERKITLLPEWVESYQEYLQQYQPKDTVFPWSPRRLEYLLEDVGKETGLSKHVSFDMCRWTCALDDWQAGMEKDTIRQKLGISKIQWREISMKLRQLAGEEPAVEH